MCRRRQARLWFRSRGTFPYRDWLLVLPNKTSKMERKARGTVGKTDSESTISLNSRTKLASQDSSACVDMTESSVEKKKRFPTLSECCSSQTRTEAVRISTEGRLGRRTQNAATSLNCHRKLIKEDGSVRPDGGERAGCCGAEERFPTETNCLTVLPKQNLDDRVDHRTKPGKTDSESETNLNSRRNWLNTHTSHNTKEALQVK